MNTEDFDFEDTDAGSRNAGATRTRSRSPRGGEPFVSPRGRQPRTAAAWQRHEAWTAPVAAPTAEHAAQSDGAAAAQVGGAAGSASASGPSQSTGAAGAAEENADLRDDESMGVYDHMIYNAPAIPQAPKFKGSTKAERRQFMREYNQYLEQVAALQTTTTKPLVMPVSACIDHYTKKRVAMWELDKTVEETTEADWIAWMRLGFDVLPSDLDAIKVRLRGAVKFDLSIVDVDSRVGKMLEGLMKALELDNQEWVLKEEGKMMVGVIVDAIKPAGLQDAVKEQIAMQRNKALKTDVIKFVRWLREYATTYQMFVKLRPDDRTPPKANKPPTGAARASGGSPKSGQPPARGAPAGGLTPKGGCLKCGSLDHLVRSCPKATPAEASELLRVNRSGAGRGGNAGGKTPGNSTNHGPGADGGRAQAARQVNAIEAPAASTPSPRLDCVVEGVLPVCATLFDSGSDTSVGSLGLVSALLAAGASVAMRDAVRPLELRPYGNDVPTITVTKKVKLNSVVFQTSYGPLVLRGLDLWVDEAVKDKAELLVGRPVMNFLGYSVDGVLAAARKQAAVWDLDALEPGPPTAMATVRRLMQVELEDGGDDEDVTSLSLLHAKCGSENSVQTT
ncbi:hypothetical protein DYB32_008020 [Aphanomyces invadans]|uniref:CCHC-type domain-containing protein n=1 Tax=Aphanomyces invadans TaxID=157072 RepID=A0A418AMF9_9STRA|nr:hypothetical protein DYB32_008020 [Aphanomyces invadans]